jgi:8-oxo-dGTP diphosphatase
MPESNAARIAGQKDFVNLTHRHEYPERPVIGVGGVVIRNGRALLIKRGHPPLQGEWSIPGGTLELCETLLEGVQRELHEETGIEVRVLDLIEVFERVFRDDAGRAQYHFVILDYLCEAVSGEARAGSDVTDAAWVAEADLERYSLTPTATRVIRRAFEMARARVDS